MILHVMSDLHLDLMRESERHQFFLRLRSRYDGEPEALVLAGDIASLRESRLGILNEALEEFTDVYSQVMFIPGNHEFWGTSIPEGLKRLKKLEKQLPKLSVLRAGKIMRFEDIGMTGDTLWFPDCGDETQKSFWCDYSYINGADSAIEAEHQKFRSQKELPEVVVTHHFPTAESIASEWRGNPNNCFFHADLDDWLVAKANLSDNSFRTRLWVHGHTHNPMDFQSKLGFRVYANPLGYAHEGMNPDFWERLRVDTESNT